jgi:diguanylate cyclase (GGDEF)-like protein
MTQLRTSTTAHLPTQLWRWVAQYRYLQQLLLLLLWLLVWQLGYLVEYTHHASVWFPAAGLTFASLLVLGRTAIPALVVVAVVVTLWTVEQYQLPLSLAQTLQAGVLFALAHITPYAAAAWLLRRLARRPQRQLPQLTLAFLLAACSSSFIAAVAVIAQLVYCQMLPFSEVSQTWLPFWIGDMAGVLVMAPLFAWLLSQFKPDVLYWLTEYIGIQQRMSRHSLYKLLFNIGLLTLVMWLAEVTDSKYSAFVVFFLVIPHMWLACTESVLVNLVGLMLSSFFIAFWVNLFALMEHVMVYQFALNVLAANTLFGLILPALIAENQRLQQVAFTDAVTQVANREYLEQQAKLLLLRCQHQQRPLSLLVFDIDLLKKINDSFGHQMGDQALQQLCHTVQQCLQPTDVLARYGGDEFVVLMPGQTLASSHAVATRILSQLQPQRIANNMPLTASFGVAQWIPAEPYVELFSRADQALYQAKQQGRNQVVVAGEVTTLAS